MVIYMQACYPIWVDCWVCSSCWNINAGFWYRPWSCLDRSPSVHSLVMGVTENCGDSGGSLWVWFSLEPFKVLAFVWRVSCNVFLCFLLAWIMQPALSHHLTPWICSLQCWVSWFPSSRALHPIWELLLNFYLHGYVSMKLLTNIFKVDLLLK